MSEDAQTEALCSSETIASYFRMLEAYESEIKKRKAKIQQLMEMLQVEAGRTFRYKGQFYQVCQRKKEGTFFFKKLDQPPKTWLNKEAREKRHTVSADVAQQKEECGASVLSSTDVEASPAGRG